MKVTTSGFIKTGNIMIIPVFEGCNKAPNNATINLNRGASIAVKSAFKSDSFNGETGESLSIWTKNCQVILLGLGGKDELTLKKSRDAGAKCLASLSKNHGTEIVVRFTSGWNLENMVSFTEGMILRDYVFDKYQKKDEDEKGPWSLEGQTVERHKKAFKLEVKNVFSVASGVHLARDLGNEPANKLFPEEFGRRALEWAKGKTNVEVVMGHVFPYAVTYCDLRENLIPICSGCNESARADNNSNQITHQNKHNKLADVKITEYMLDKFPRTFESKVYNKWRNKYDLPEL